MRGHHIKAYRQPHAWLQDIQLLKSNQKCVIGYYDCNLTFLKNSGITKDATNDWNCINKHVIGLSTHLTPIVDGC